MHPINLIFPGASPVRRDFGRGFTASQWARFCGRSMCAESIEKFVRTAVPGGAALISADNSGGSISSLHGKKAVKSGGTRHRSRSASSKNASWLTRTIRRAFKSTGDEEGFAVTKPKSFKFGMIRQSRHSSKKRPKSPDIVIPQVEVTLLENQTENIVATSPERPKKKNFGLGKKHIL